MLYCLHRPTLNKVFLLLLLLLLLLLILLGSLVHHVLINVSIVNKVKT